MTDLTRRQALAAMGMGALALFERAHAAAEPPGRLRSRPRVPIGSMATGLSPLGLAAGRDGMVYVPPSYRAGTPAPLVVLLHGAGQDEHVLIDPMRPLADETGLVLVAPVSRGSTWDAIRDDFGPDVAFIDAALAKVFARVNVDPNRVRVAGFSDGASYALPLGMINGALFSKIAAFSPGFIAGGRPAAEGKPKMFITHGTEDQILNIDRTSRRLVPLLKRDGYDVEYHEFKGRHGVNPDLLRQAATWLAAR